MTDIMPRRPEPEPMDLDHEAFAYAEADFAEVNEAFVEAMLAHCPHEPTRALDLGTGPGDIPLRVARQRGDWRITACDCSAAMLDLARAAVNAAGMDERIELVLADAKALPFEDDSFDVVFSNSILHHVASPVAFWRESARVLRPGGLLFLRDLYRPVNETVARELVVEHAGNESPLLQEEFYRSLLAAYTPDEIRRQLAAAGLDAFHVHPITDRHLDVFGRA